MTNRIFQRRSIWWPTLLGWLVIGIAAASPLLLWCFAGEAFLARTAREPADILVVEGWIGIEGITAAQAEFVQGGYRYIVATGGINANRWETHEWSYAAETEKLLLQLGVPSNQIILASTPDVKGHRTFASAVATCRNIQSRGIQARTINVFTFGVHARRSRLVYAKAQPRGTEVGVIAWTPPGYYSGRWWQSSERSLNFIKETEGYLFEVFLNSGRTSNSSAPSAPGSK